MAPVVKAAPRCSLRCRVRSTIHALAAADAMPIASPLTVRAASSHAVPVAKR
jgi:hypothetical protein